MNIVNPPAPQVTVPDYTRHFWLLVAIESAKVILLAIIVIELARR